MFPKVFPRHDLDPARPAWPGWNAILKVRALLKAPAFALEYPGRGTPSMASSPLNAPSG
jgi:hypothetical protein